MIFGYFRRNNTLKWFLLIISMVIVGCANEEKEPPAKLSISASPEVVVSMPKKEIKANPMAPDIKSQTISTKEIKTLDEALKAGVPVIVKLGTDKCIPCRAMNQIIKELAVEQDGKAVFLSLDVYENRELAGQAGVRVIPTILFYDKRGAPRAKAEGGMSKEELLKAIEELGLNK